jgi:hypothetical protein
MNLRTVDIIRHQPSFRALMPGNRAHWQSAWFLHSSKSFTNRDFSEFFLSRNRQLFCIPARSRSNCPMNRPHLVKIALTGAVFAPMTGPLIQPLEDQRNKILQDPARSCNRSCNRPSPWRHPSLLFVQSADTHGRRDLCWSRGSVVRYWRCFFFCRWRFF